MKRAVPLAALLLLCACVASPPPDYHYYRLNIAAPAKPGTKGRITGLVLVEAPRAPAVYVPRTIAYSEDAEHLTLAHYHYHSWIDPPALLLQQDLARYLQAAGIGSAVVTVAESDSPDYRVRGEIRHFERIRTPRGWAAAVALELRADRAGGTVPVLVRHYEQLAVAGDATMEATIEAFSAAVTTVFREFTADLSKAGAGKAGE